MIKKIFKFIYILTMKQMMKPRKIFKKLVDKSTNINDLNDTEATNLIRGDEIDIAFDLMGATPHIEKPYLKTK